jgi:uncharacterized membrane protein YgcG
MISLFSRVMKLSLATFVYSMEMAVKTMQGIREMTSEGIDIVSNSMIEELSLTPIDEEFFSNEENPISEKDFTNVENLLIHTNEHDSFAYRQNNIQQKEIKMPNTDLDNDRVNLVRYTIVTIKRGYESILQTGGEELVKERMSGEAFAAWVVARYAERNKIPDADKQYLRVYYEVLQSWPKQDLRYEERQLDILERIASQGVTIAGSGGGSGSGGGATGSGSGSGSGGGSRGGPRGSSTSGGTSTSSE